MDANMPVMDGFTAARVILSTHGAAAPAIVALTASVLEEDRQRCLDAGMIGFLPKPLRIDELSEALARYAADQSAAAITLAAPLAAQEDTALPAAPMVLMDWSRLEQFKEFDDEDRSMTREVIALFVADAPVREADLAQALRASDSAALSRAAHALKGAASNVGAVALADACFVLEQACLQGRWPMDAAQLVAIALDYSEQTRRALQDFSL
jgi:HPt (histidine-containing phosphotransfer) domain-containing protein